MPIAIATVDRGRTSIDESALDQFAASIRGELLKPGDSRYSEKPVYNAMYDRRPALIVRCTGTADVVDAINFARQALCGATSIARRRLSASSCPVASCRRQVWPD